MATRVSDERIFDATVSAVRAHGYEGATTRQIAAVAGINEVTLFRRFGDKRALLQAAIAGEVEEFVLAGPAYTGDLEADLSRVVTFYRDVFQGRGQLFVALLAELPRHPELAALVKQPLRVIGEMHDMIATYQREGRLCDGSPGSVLNALLGPLLAEAVSAQVLGTDGAGTVSATRQVARFLHGHQGRDHPPAAAASGERKVEASR